MLEIAIAVGLGAWFTLTIVVSCVAIFKDFKDVKTEDERK